LYGSVRVEQHHEVSRRLSHARVGTGGESHVVVESHELRIRREFRQSSGNVIVRIVVHDYQLVTLLELSQEEGHGTPEIRERVVRDHHDRE
jgi:hypothetical protein